MTVSVFGVTQGWLSSTRSWETTIPVCLVDNVQDESKNYFLCSLRCTLCLYMSVFCNHMLIKAGYGSLKVSSTDDIPKPITPIKTQPIETRTKQKSGRVRILQYSTSPVDRIHQNARIQYQSCLTILLFPSSSPARDVSSLLLLVVHGTQVLGPRRQRLGE